jgi:methionyl-tRNA synthetase
MLKAAGLPIYERLVVHGHILSLDGRKMGKSLGNAIDPLAMLDKYGVDALHYALLRDTTLGSDSFFGEETIIARFNADLANDLGNLLSRVRTMVLRYLGGVLPAPSPHDSVLAKEGVALAGRVRKWVDELKIHLALEEVFQYVRSLNKFVNDSKPWELAKDGAKHKELEDTLYVAVEGMRIASVLLEAALPTKSGELRRALGLGDFTVEQTETWGLSPAGTRIPEEAAILFPKMERATQENQDLSQPPISPTTHQNSPSLAVAADPPLQLLPEVQIDDFAKIELRVIDVLAAEKHPKADKLLVLTVSLGSQQRTVVSGIAQWYRPEDLVGKKLILVANLKPAKLRGVDSQGMILAGEDAQGRIVVVEAEAGLPAGAKVR